jgi:serine/threonine protein phosphatase 1
MLTYAIGDIHGCLDLLTRLLRDIREHAGERDHRLVFLGDYIDRGPDSAGVLDHVRDLQARRPERVICLKGNHEDMMLQAVDDPRRAFNWTANGGDAALASFGARSLGDIPEDIIRWVAALPTSFEDERRFFVHAGLQPGVPLSAQREADKLWIREPFLGMDHDFGRHVVHGHTPLVSGRPDVRRFRTNLDTAAVFGGALTAGVFTPDQDKATAFLQVFLSGG